MKVRKGLVAIGFASVLAMAMVAAPRADAAAHIFVRPAFGFYYGPGPAWYGPWGNYWYVPAPTTGDVKVNTPVKGESIYVDGGFAGQTGKLKKFSLGPGNHQIEVRDATGRDVYQNTVHVIAGKTLDINL